MVMQAAGEDVEHCAASQRHQHHKLHQGEATTAFLGGGLGIALLVFPGVRQLRGGAVHHFDGPALQLTAGARAPVCGLGGGGHRFFQALFGQPQPGLDIGGVAGGRTPQARQPEECLDLADDLAAGGPGLEHLPEETFQGQAQSEHPFPAVGALILAGQERGGQKITELILELGEGGLAEGVHRPAAEGGQPGAEGGEIRGAHWHSIHTVPLDSQLRMRP
jgi:hypothetical protein